MRKCAIILASGKGTRFSRDGTPKQFVEVLGETILEHSIRACDCGLFDDIVVAVNNNMVDGVKSRIARNKYLSNVTVITGGSTRTESCSKCVSSIKDEDAFIVVHNGAQPLVSKCTLEKCLDGLLISDAVITAVPCTYTLMKVGDDGFVKDIPDRSEFMNDMGEEGFRLSVLRKILSSVEDVKSSTNICHAAIRSGIANVMVVEGDPGNIKVTYKHDILYVEQRLRENREKNKHEKRY